MNNHQSEIVDKLAQILGHGEIIRCELDQGEWSLRVEFQGHEIDIRWFDQKEDGEEQVPRVYLDNAAAPLLASERSALLEAAQKRATESWDIQRAAILSMDLSGDN